MNFPDEEQETSPSVPQFPMDRVELSLPSIPEFPADRIEKGEKSSDIRQKNDE